MVDDPTISAIKPRTSAPSWGGIPAQAVETIAKARTLRAEHATAAAYQAHRVEQARAAAHHTEAARWTEEYRRSVARCRLLGELIRRERPRSPAAAARPSTTVPFASAQAESDLPETGEAA
jgi:hypothetical protein